MSSRPWQTNAHEKLREFADRYRLVVEDVEQIYSFIRRLEIDPGDILAKMSHVGEYYCRIGPSATVPGRVLACGYRIDAPHRSVEVISFSLPRGRNRPTYGAFEVPIASRVLAFCPRGGGPLVPGDRRSPVR